MVRNTERHFPALRIAENERSEEDILHTFNYSFVAVERVEKKGKSWVIHFDPDNEQDLGSWDTFYEDLDEYEKLYVEKTPRQDDAHGYGILYYKEPRADCWEVRYARKTSPRISTTSTNPRYVPKARKIEQLNRETGQMEVIVIPRKVPLPRTTPPVIQCTCACSCGARLGISI